ncbi:MAG: fumarylacetoacetate hydrolase family protein [Candidatus Marinimicrobia bacterium]|nr:fumarylacetoacetate hydrolase family protein [Candidatus Neomarinimicrobiota bacterium]MDD5581728.1 fumarylacetoacetate hydrolase family protein [Candidatus Neomarinimicrobiota bacterium]
MTHAILQPVEKAFPVPKILGVDHNYPDRFKEENYKDVYLHPVIFLKPPQAIVHSPGPVELPFYSNRVEYEVEVTLLIGTEGRNIDEMEASGLIAGVGVGVDLTARDVLLEAKKEGRSWIEAKCFDNSALISHFVSILHFPRLDNLNFRLYQNGVLRQSGNTVNMVYKIPEILSYISTIMTLLPGDIIFTGTPAGVGPVFSGDQLVIELEHEISEEFLII